MHIVNIMFSPDGGGIEQAFIDYCEGLQARGHRITAISFPDAVVNKSLIEIGITPITIRNFGEWDLFAANRLRKQLLALDGDIIVAHANRAFSLAKKAIKGTYPLVGLAQNYHTRRLNHADAAFATTHDLINRLTAQGIAAKNIFHIPNMVRCNELPHRPRRNNPPVIGTLGRFVRKKGFDVYIEALAQLKQRGYVFKAILGGGGAEENNLKVQAHKAGLEDILSFPGWIEDKKEFYTGIDLFCLPSLHEPFGIVLLEAFTYGAPVVATDTEGPHDIITDQRDALIVEKGNATQLADALGRLLDNHELADHLAANAFAKTKTQYSLDVGCERIENALNTVFSRWKNHADPSVSKAA